MSIKMLLSVFDVATDHENEHTLDLVLSGLAEMDGTPGAVIEKDLSAQLLQLLPDFPFTLKLTDPSMLPVYG